MTDDAVRTEGQLDAVERTVVAEERSSGLHTVVTLSQSYATDVADLWEACTDPERLARWFGPVSGDLRRGGRYQIEGNAGGTIQTCEPPHAFTATWEFEGHVSSLAVRIEPEGETRARLTLEHTADVGAEDWGAYGPGAGGVGWDLALLGLANHLATGSAVPPESTAWVDTEDARRFIADASRRWADGSIAAGTPTEAARAAEQRTSAAWPSPTPTSPTSPPNREL